VSLVFDEQGYALQLGKKLGEGGEGAVFDTAHNGENVAAKIYSRALTPERQEKLRAMTHAGDTYLEQIAAWPISVLLSKRSGPVAGFTMPKFSGYHAVHELYGVGSRRQTFPKVDFAFLVGAARNIAAAFDAIHAHGHAIGDVNENNIIVSDQGTVKLLDCDSFHVNTPSKSYPCTVGVPHYTPPELQGLGSFHGVTRTANHDNFGLAVLIFQLLFMARHPFSGIPKMPGDLPLERSIKEFRFAYGADRHARLNDMPPKALGLDYLPARIGDFFWRAFTETGVKHGRPKASDWVSALEGLLRSLRTCSVEPRHKYPGHLHTCVWCERDKLGTPYFTPASSTGPTFSFQATNASIAALWSQIQALGMAPYLPVFTGPTLQLAGRPTSASTGSSINSSYVAYVVICFVAFLLTAAVPKAWLLWIAAGAFAIKSVKSEDSAELKERQDALVAAQQTYDAALAEYNKVRSSRKLVDLYTELGRIKAELDNLPQVLAREMKHLQATLTARQLHDFLDRYFIRAAKITGVGEQRKQTLASFGIETAADITTSAIEAIPGFGAGLTNNLVEWRRSIANKFVPSSNATPSPQDVNAVHAKITSVRGKLEQQLRTGAASLQTVKHEELLRQSAVKETLDSAFRALAQAKADLAVIKRSP
jgi:DNA-binding helix-hairpin-helix protein with protein kinase domain